MNSISNQLTQTLNSQKDLFQIPNNIFLSRKTLWDPDPYLSNNIIMSNTKRRSRWSSQYSKTFTPLPIPNPHFWLKIA